MEFIRCVPVHLYWLTKFVSNSFKLVIVNTSLSLTGQEEMEVFFTKPHHMHQTAPGLFPGFTWVTFGCHDEPFGTVGSMQCGGESWRADVGSI